MPRRCHGEPARRPRIRVTVSRVVDEDTVGTIAPSPGELFSQTNDAAVAILLSYGTTRGLLPCDAEARKEEHMISGTYTRP
jgi:hypothetical protein